MKVNVVSWNDLLDSIPHGLSRDQKVRDEVLKAYQFELMYIIKQAQEAEKSHDVSIFMGKFPEGDQIAFFEIRLTDVPMNEKQVNWHGQNTSQWAYAGCIQVSKEGR
jgi:hypothetical protein